MSSVHILGLFGESSLKYYAEVLCTSCKGTLDLLTLLFFIICYRYSGRRNLIVCIH